MQKFIANGWVSRKNELKENQNGTKRLTFDFAARNNHRDKNGEPTSTFFLVELMGKQAEFFEDKISKGQPLLIVGEILERRYEKDGQTQYFRYLAPDLYGGITFLSKKEVGNGNDSSPEDLGQGFNYDFADELPF
ncbi:single-stranded DNA-binding protein [Bacilli bacterium]|nr:single-stranded DNA-binding protein [Bacilli bacterium]